MIIIPTITKELRSAQRMRSVEKARVTPPLSLGVGPNGLWDWRMPGQHGAKHIVRPGESTLHTSPTITNVEGLIFIGRRLRYNLHRPKGFRSIFPGRSRKAREIMERHSLVAKP